MDSIQKGAEGLMTTGELQELCFCAYPSLPLPPDEAKEFADSNRLIPTFDATATEPNDVYPLHNIIPEAEWKALSVSAFDSTTNDKERLALLPHRSSEWVRRPPSSTAWKPRTSPQVRWAISRSNRIIPGSWWCPEVIAPIATLTLE